MLLIVLLLKRNETPPTWKACIRLLVFIFTSTIGIPEFQRQLATPNVPKLSAALLSLAEKNEDHEIRVTLPTHAIIRVILIQTMLARFYDGAHASCAALPDSPPSASQFHVQYVSAISLWFFDIPNAT